MSIPAGAGALLNKRLGKYEILALLALGGTAEIYLARIAGAAGFEKYVVVKCLHDHLADDTEFVKMFLDEARLAAHLDHSNIVQTMELGEHENRYYMVMEYLAGMSLAMVVRRANERLPGGRMPPSMSLNIIAQSAAGLHYAHEKAMNGKALNIVHRDISPQNLVVSFEGIVKVVDFGIAKAELRETQTRSGTIKGKFAYMSPEQCVAANVDRRTDVFALGVITHELLTGRRLFKKPSPYETYQAVIECNVDPPSKLNVELDPALDPIVMKALAKDKEKRYQTAEAFGDALLSYLHHRGKSSSPNDVARFFDTSFANEIEEHGARMRELISGREFANSGETAGWGEDEKDNKRNETVDLSARHQADIERYSKPSLSDVVSELGAEGGTDEGQALGDDDDDAPVEHTRIESNPLDKLQEVLAATPTPAPKARAATEIPSIAIKPPARVATPPVGIPSGPLLPQPAQAPTVVAAIPTPPPMMAVNPLPPVRNTPAPMKIPSITGSSSGQMVAQAAHVAPLTPPLTGPLRLPDPPVPPMRHSQPAMATVPNVPSGRFPDSANMATQIAQSDDNEETREAARAFPDGYQPEPALAATHLAAQPLDLSKVPRVTAIGPNAQTGLELPPAPQGPLSGVVASPGPLSSNLPITPVTMRPSNPALPTGYPVMDSQMRDGMASGAAVFPGVPVGRASRPTNAGQGVDSGAHAARPPSGQYAPHPPSGQHGAFDPQRAVDLASPVGGNYPDQDWAAAAAMPARALPTWMLVALFMGALAAAMLVVFIIARIAH